MWKMRRRWRQRWLLLFHYVAKMAAVEYEKCTSIHTPLLDRFEGTIQVLSVHFFPPDLNWNALHTQTKYSEYGKYGYRNTAQGRSPALFCLWR